MNQARAPIVCARQFLRELLREDGLFAELPRRDRVRFVLKLNERLFRFARTKRAKDAYARFGIDPFAAVIRHRALPAQSRAPPLSS